MGGQGEADQRCRLNQGVQRDIIEELQTMLHETHPYVQSFKFALEQMQIPDHKVVIKADRRPAGEHARRFNAPVNNEVAILMVGEEHGKRDIVLKQRDNILTTIKETHRSYDSLQYPLMFPRGEDGYSFSLRQVNRATGEETAKTISCKDFYAYRLMIRDDKFNQVLKFKEVTSQLMVDMYAKIETERLLYIRLNQKQLRAEQYSSLQDAMNINGNAENIGQQVILPSSFTGSPRYMHQRTQGAMAYVRKFSHPDPFIMFTCNPKWDDIQENLFDGQNRTDRHDIIDGNIFGELHAWLYTIEWQKRGLPHSHTLIWCKNKIQPEDIDSIISAELPDPEEDPELYNTLQTQMVHGPCGQLNQNSPCMEDGKCTKRFPKQLLQETQTGRDGYPLYRRRAPEDDGHTAKLQVRGQEVEIDKRWIIPYNKLLSKTFNAHINVESCQSIKSIKYVCKCINKGSDVAVFGVEQEGRQQRDEISHYQMGHYISSNEAIWRILGFNIHERYPTVVNLAVHLENGQRVYFTEETAQNVLEQPPETTLTAFFKLCQHDPFARTLLYADVPLFYTWSNTKWSRCKRGVRMECWEEDAVFRSDAIGRVYTVHPNQQECFYLRLLLHTVTGPTSFEDLRTFEGEVCTTYREACAKHGLLEDDAHWDQTLEEAAATRHSRQLRQLFAIMLITCGMAEPLQLWEKHRDSMAEDILYRVQRQSSTEINYSGTGKTFVINLLLAKLRQMKKVALAVASSGIAATLLDGGRTDHSAFKLPLDLAKRELPTCNISRGTTKAKLLSKSKLIIWDEATMSHKGAFEALDRTLQDLRRNTSLMGGVTVLLSGDFCQTLPVIPKGTRADEFNACIKSSHLWTSVLLFSLKTNMKVQLSGDEEAGIFSQQLLEVGNGTLKVDSLDSQVKLPFGHTVEDINELVDKVFPKLKLNFRKHSWLSERAILAPKNLAVDVINEKLLEQLPGEAVSYMSVDTVPDPDEVVNYPVEFLNTLAPAGLPPHRLVLKVGAPVMLLRNLDPPKLCNCTRLIIKTLMPRVLKATVITGKAKGEDVFIPRIPLIPSDMAFEFRCLQFPVKPSFAMSINKAQGQSLKVVSLNLAEPVFSHGQLYVGCSRVGNPKQLFIHSPEGRTRNIVCQEALQS
ncbi:uncharacterized protein LOC117526576 [Thalassophryne amazonica]|uniref:uncharacterized protein LOC117526576 n=1 Tax=Thalassophryne amazonica TaxID=390379 RepID=UPI0014724F26|nr:uncharacterized protein LOC117526576 [Thalassophryne amazonica]